MKKLYSILATAFAFAFIVASPVTSITSHAEGWGFNANAPMHDGDSKMPDNYWSGDSSSSSHNESSSNDSGSHDSGNYDSGSHNDGLGFNADAAMYDGDSVMSDDYWSASTPAKNPNDVTTSVTGGQSFRIVMNKTHTSYEVYHCGIVKAGFAVTDAKGNAVTYKNVALEQGEDKLWYANITFADGVDTTGYVVTATKGDATYLSTTLGVSGIKVNGVLALSTVPVQ